MSFLPRRFHAVHTAPVWMSMHERVLLYGLVVGLQPRCTLEIGTFKGGSTLIITAALDDLDTGEIICVDPEPHVADEDWAAVRHRAKMVAEPSPPGVTSARELASEPFDFAFIDGDHTLEGVCRDIDATLPVLADSAHLLFHDAHYYEVREAIDAAVVTYGERLIDAGLVSVFKTDDTPAPDGSEVAWGGLRLLRFRRI